MKIHLSLVLFLSAVYVNAQSISNEVVSSNGNHYKNANMEVSWTVGEVVTETQSNSSVTLTQGFHQVEIIEDTSNPGGIISDLDIDISVFPNPSSKVINLTINEQKELNILLFDAHGKEIKTLKMKEEQEEIEISKLAEGIYFLKIYDDKNKFIKSFKVEKFNR